MAEKWQGYAAKIFDVLLYIQENLNEKMSLNELSRIAHISPYHFHRLFRAYIGESLHQYIKRLRLEAAAGKVILSKKTITEIGLDSGYDNPSSFTKAFRKHMGMSPIEYREKDAQSQRKYSKQGKTMKVEFINTHDLPLYFIREVGDYTTSTEAAWNKMDKFIEGAGLDRTKLRYFGIGHDNPDITESEKIRFDACINYDGELNRSGVSGHQTFEGGNYAVFTHHGSHSNLEQTYEYIYRDWLPKSGKSLENKPFFWEYLSNPCDKKEIKEEDLVTKVYIALES